MSIGHRARDRSENAPRIDDTRPDAPGAPGAGRRGPGRCWPSQGPGRQRATCTLGCCGAVSPLAGCWQQGRNGRFGPCCWDGLRGSATPLPRDWVHNTRNRHQSKQGSSQSTSESWGPLLEVKGPALLRSGAVLPQFPHMCPGVLFSPHLVLEIILRIQKRDCQQ